GGRAGSQQRGSVENALRLGAAFAAGSDRVVFVCTDGSAGRLVVGVSAVCRSRRQTPSTDVPWRAVLTPDGRRALEVGQRSSRVVDTTNGAVLATVAAGLEFLGEGGAVEIDAGGRRLL